MKKNLILFLCLLALVSASYGQGCLSGGIVFSTQTQIDNFAANNPGCSVIEGDVRVVGNNITNIDGLLNITSIEGDLLIDLNPMLLNVDGLANLSNVDGYVWFFDNDALTDVSGLNNLQQIGGYLSFEDNDALEEINGLNALEEVGDYVLVRFSDKLTTIGGLNALKTINELLIIRDNPLLENLDGLENLTTIGNSLWIFTNDALQNINALSGLDDIGLDIIIQQNDQLTNFNGLQGISALVGKLDIQGNNGLMNLIGLENIETIDGSLYLNNNSPLEDLSELQNLKTLGDFLGIDFHTTLKSLDGLDNLESIGGFLSFRNNDVLDDLQGLSGVTSIDGELLIDGQLKLATLDGLENIDPASITELTITNSPLLTECAVSSICGYLQRDGISVTVNNNATGCNTGQEIIDDCFSKGEIPVSFQLANRLTFGDPCNCNDPLNCQIPNGAFLFHDKLRIPETGTVATGLDIRINTATGIFLDVSCNGGTLTEAMNGDPIPETSPGVYEIEFWRPSGVQPTLTVIESSMVTMAPAATFQPICNVSECAVPVDLPAINIKGLMFLALIMLSLSSVLIMSVARWGR